MVSHLVSSSAGLWVVAVVVYNIEHVGQINRSVNRIPSPWS